MSVFHEQSKRLKATERKGRKERLLKPQKQKEKREKAGVDGLLEGVGRGGGGGEERERETERTRQYK